MKFAVISDLHVGRAARAKELSPYADDESLEDGFLAALETFAEQELLKCDYLVVPGDLTNTAHPAECTLAGSVIARIADLLQVPPSNVLVVPGNHDTSWILPKKLEEAFATDNVVLKKPGHLERFSSIGRYFPFYFREGPFSEFLAGQWDRLLHDPYFAILDNSDALIAVYNSAFNDSADKKPHNGEAHSQHLSKIKAALLALPDNTSPRPRVFVVHHHVHQHLGVEYKWADFSIMHNADGLQQLLIDQGFDLLIHGHKHFPRFATHSLSGSKPLAILGAGSFSRLLSSQEVEVLGNTFHIIETVDRASNGALRGQVLTWVYRQTHGWLPSDKARHSIAHKRPFGCIWDDTTLDANLESASSKALNSAPAIKLENVLTGNLAEARFADTDRLAAAIHRISTKLALNVVNPEEGDPRKWVLLKV